MLQNEIMDKFIEIETMKYSFALWTETYFYGFRACFFFKKLEIKHE